MRAWSMGGWVRMGVSQFWGDDHFEVLIYIHRGTQQTPFARPQCLAIKVKDTSAGKLDLLVRFLYVVFVYEFQRICESSVAAPVIRYTDSESRRIFVRAKEKLCSLGSFFCEIH
mmetsp:Transcript_32176/g.80143  ORF Transcript_32176/g.80143 Transcript_32176/m.80143 type:complete len:114 (+) Transcript_32176:179-520(+)